MGRRAASEYHWFSAFRSQWTFFQTETNETSKNSAITRSWKCFACCLHWTLAHDLNFYAIATSTLLFFSVETSLHTVSNLQTFGPHLSIMMSAPFMFSTNATSFTFSYHNVCKRTINQTLFRFSPITSFLVND